MDHAKARPCTHREKQRQQVLIARVVAYRVRCLAPVVKQGRAVIRLQPGHDPVAKRQRPGLYSVWPSVLVQLAEVMGDAA